MRNMCPEGRTLRIGLAALEEARKRCAPPLNRCLLCTEESSYNSTARTPLPRAESFTFEYEMSHHVLMFFNILSQPGRGGGRAVLRNRRTFEMDGMVLKVTGRRTIHLLVSVIA